MNYRSRIVADSQVLAGKPVIKGTRLSVDFILSLLAQGWTESEILGNYPDLEPEDLRALFAFAQAYLAEEEYISAAGGTMVRRARPEAPRMGIEEERAFMRAVVAGLADLDAGREVSLADARARLGPE